MRRPSALVQSSSALSRRPSAQERSRLMAERGAQAGVIILCACVSLALVQDGSNTVTASVASGGGG